MGFPSWSISGSEAIKPDFQIGITGAEWSPNGKPKTNTLSVGEIISES